MGYCPQNSALIKTLNSRDHLKLFACLRGVPKNQVSSEVEKWINRLSKYFFNIELGFCDYCIFFPRFSAVGYA